MSIFSQQRAPAASTEKTLDLVHLSAQCLGDGDLEKELLRLFRVQAIGALTKLSVAVRTSPDGAAAFAHELRGAALAVGANRVARAAAMIEIRQRPSSTRDGDEAALADLEISIKEAVAEIDRLRVV